MSRPACSSSCLLLGIMLVVACRSATPADCDTPCGDHEYCDTSAVECACVAGYAGDPCVWEGVFEDSQFTDPSAWDVSSGSTVVPLAEGGTGPGLAAFEGTTVCRAGSVSKVVEMPHYEDAEPLVAEATFRQDNVAGGVVVGYNRAFRRLLNTRPYPEWNDERFCLGAAAYGQGDSPRGGPVKFQIAAGEFISDCLLAPVGIIEVDRFEIRAADEGECPEIGVVTNGQAEPGEGGWEFWTPLQAGGVIFGGVVQAALEPGVGESEGGARLYGAPQGAPTWGALLTELSVPLARELPSPLLRFWWRGTAGHRFKVQLGTFPEAPILIRSLDNLLGDGESHVASYCLPPWTHGNVAQLSFLLRVADGAEAELVVDNVEISSDERCGDGEELFDPSFDSAPHRWPGVSVEEEPSLPSQASNAVRVLSDPERAFSAPGVLEITYATDGVGVYAQTWVYVPRSDGNRGPQMTIRSNIPADAPLPTFWVVGNALPADRDDPLCQEGHCPPSPFSGELPRGLDWRQTPLCLPSQWAERWLRVQFSTRASPSEPPYEIFDTPFTVLLDDLEVRLSEACPPSD